MFFDCKKFFNVSMAMAFIFCSIFSGLTKCNPINFLKQFIKDGDLVFDVGAHVGCKADLFLKCGARVVCIEPQPLCVKALESEFKNNDKIIIINKGLATKPGKMFMQICSQATVISTFSLDMTKRGRFPSVGYVWDKVIEVDMTTLDELIKVYGMPQFIKIDVENFEYEVISGLTKKVPALSFEFMIEYINNTEKCLERLDKLGFTRFNFAIGDTPQLVLPEWVSHKALLVQLKSGSFDARGGLWGDIYACI